MATRVKIIATPPGQAPEWVRKEWIGVEIQLPQQTPGGIQVGSRGGKAENTGGYQVKTDDAITALEQKAPEAAQWWKDNVPLESIAQLVFAKSVCELVT